MLVVCLRACIHCRQNNSRVSCRASGLSGAAAWVGFNEPWPWLSPPPLSACLHISASFSILPELLKHLFSHHKTSGYFCLKKKKKKKSVYSAFSSHIAAWAKCGPNSSFSSGPHLTLIDCVDSQRVWLLQVDHSFTCYRPDVRWFVTFRLHLQSPGSSLAHGFSATSGSHIYWCCKCQKVGQICVCYLETLLWTASFHNAQNSYCVLTEDCIQLI